MKLTRRILVMALALMMLMAMATTAFAANITVNGTSGTEYTVYKMYSIETLDGTEVYKANTGWEDFVAYSTVGNYLQQNGDYVSVKNGVTLTEADKAALAQLAKEYVKAHPTLAPFGTVKADTTGNTIADADNGYYLLMAASGANGLTKVGTSNVTVTDKNSGTTTGLPAVSKLVREDSDDTWGTANTADMGQTINFKTTITASNDASNYILHDTMDSQITFNNDIKVQYVDGKGTSDTTDDAAAVDVALTDYNVTTSTGDGCTFHVTFEQTFLDTLENYDSIIVTYSGYLNETAAVEVAYKNTTKLTHTDVNAETASATTTTTTYEVVLEKKGNGGVALAGAEFVLMNSEGKYYQMTAGKVAWVDSVDAATKQVSAVAGGKALASFIGVDAGDYKLVETKAPNGYITPTGAAAVTSTNAGSTYVDHVSTITNVLGEPLPETGGIGTTIFYIIGGVLVAGAVVLLITKKRMTSAE